MGKRLNSSGVGYEKAGTACLSAHCAEENPAHQVCLSRGCAQALALAKHPCVLCVQWPGHLELLLCRSETWALRSLCPWSGLGDRAGELGWVGLGMGVIHGEVGPNFFLLGEIHIVYWLDLLILMHHEPKYQLSLGRL